MKGTWGRPAVNFEKFVANDYVAACGKTPTGQYIFTCDAPAGRYYYYEEVTERHIGYFVFACRPETVLEPRGGGAYHPCGSKHITSTADAPEYQHGFIDRNGNGVEDEGETALLWWGPDEHGQVGHATISLTPEEVEVVRS